MRKSINKDASFIISMMKLEPEDIIGLIESEFDSGQTIDVPLSHDKAFFVPGTRDDRCLLVAHTDTVFAGESVNPGRNGCFISSYSKGVGIGADDRAGVCGLLKLRDLGHSLLFVPEEEAGCVGSGWIAKNMPEILENHSFMIQLDRKGAFDLVTYDVGTEEFEKYLVSNMPNYEVRDGSFSDIVELCPAVGICGVNISIGFYHEHSSHEILDMMGWVRTVDMLRKFLSGPLLPFTYTPSNYTLSDMRDSSPYYGSSYSLGRGGSYGSTDADSDQDFEESESDSEDYGIEETEEDYFYCCHKCNHSFIMKGFRDEEQICSYCHGEMEACPVEDMISEELRSLRETQTKKKPKVKK